MLVCRNLLLSVAGLGLVGTASGAFTAGPVTCQTTNDGIDVTFTCTATTGGQGNYIAVGFAAPDTASFHALNTDGVLGYPGTVIDGQSQGQNFQADADQADVTLGTMVEQGTTGTLTFKRKITPADPADLPFTATPITVWGTTGPVNNNTPGHHGGGNYGSVQANVLQQDGGGGGGGGGVRPPQPVDGWDGTYQNQYITVNWARSTPDQNAASLMFEVECQTIYWCAIGWTNKLAHDSADSVILHSGSAAVDSVAPTGNDLVQHKGDDVNNIVLEYGEVTATSSYYRFSRPTVSPDTDEDVALVFGTQKLVYGIGNDIPVGDGPGITYGGHAATAAGRGTQLDVNFLQGPPPEADQTATYALIGLGGAAFLGGASYFFGAKVAPEQMQAVGTGFNRMTQQFIASPMQQFGTRMSTAFKPNAGGGGGGMSPVNGMPNAPMMDMGGGGAPMGGMGAPTPMGGSFNGMGGMGSPAPDAPPRNNGWKSAVDPNSGQVYYYNKMLGETSWTAPPGFNL